jgi:hypothetical protein
LTKQTARRGLGYYSGAMLALAVLLAERDSVYDDMVVKFLEQLVW